jgi:hypothetical protein
VHPISALAAVAITYPGGQPFGRCVKHLRERFRPGMVLGAGSHTLSATATDLAGNVGSGSATFSVTVSSTDLCTLTRQFVDGSAKYQAQTPASRTAIDAVVKLDCLPMGVINLKLAVALKQPLIALYKLTLQPLALGGWLTPGQVTTLGGLAGAL